MLCQKILARYPSDRSKSAILPLLHLAQKQNNNYISDQVIEYISELLSLPNTKVKEVVTFYSMFNQKPVGSYLLQFCRTTPCMLCGGDELKDACEKYLGIKEKETTLDGIFTIVAVECLGACTSAPVVQINDDYHEKMTPESLISWIEKTRRQFK